MERFILFHDTFGEFLERHQYYGTEIHLESIEHAFFSVLETIQNLIHVAEEMLTNSRRSFPQKQL